MRKIALGVIAGVAVCTTALFALPPIFLIECGEPTVCMHFGQIKVAIDSHYLDFGRDPGNLNELLKNDKRAYMERLPVDPWGNQYVYLSTGEYAEHGRYVVLSLGADGQFGGLNENADIASNGSFCLER